jgi:hypothetical protein
LNVFCRMNMLPVGSHPQVAGRVVMAKKACEKLRTPVELELRQLRNSAVQNRLKALAALAEKGRRPVPMRVAYLGALEVLAGGVAREAGGLGDPEVVARVLAMADDDEWHVRLAVVASLARVCLPGEDVVVGAIAKLVVDPVPPRRFLLSTQPSTLNPQPSTHNPQPSTLNPQP